MTEIALLVSTLLLAYSNGANDNFKGVATLYGSDVLTYARARTLSTAATILGAVAAAYLADALLKSFSGRGLVPAAVVNDPAFAASVALAAGATVALATRIGMPVSTTHALVGALVGAGVVAAFSEMKLAVVGQQFFAPLLFGPIIAFAVAAVLAWLQRRFWATPDAHADQPCACVSFPDLYPAVGAAASAAPSVAVVPLVALGTTQGTCASQNDSGTALVATESRAIIAAHVMSAAAVCFARGLNDAPKIAALLLVAKSVDAATSIASVAIAMALGGWFHSRRIAETMSHKIIKLEPRGSFLANLCTACLVISASKYGLPLSTTHVSVGAISGLAAGGERISGATLRHILLSWVATLPCAALLGALDYVLLSHILH